jgi:hypothetical protein
MTRRVTRFVMHCASPVLGDRYRARPRPMISFMISVVPP